MVASVDADVLLLDVSMPGPPFLDVLTKVRAVQPNLRILVLTMHPEDQFRGARTARRRFGLPDKGPDSPTSCSRRSRASRGRPLHQLGAGRAAWRRNSNGNFNAAPHDKLSDREMEVLLLLGSGLTVKESAASLRLQHEDREHLPRSVAAQDAVHDERRHRAVRVSRGTDADEQGVIGRREPYPSSRTLHYGLMGPGPIAGHRARPTWRHANARFRSSVRCLWCE